MRPKRYFSSLDKINTIHVAGVRCPVCGDHHIIGTCWHKNGTCLNNEASIERFYCEKSGIGFDTWSQNMLTSYTDDYSRPILFSIVLRRKSSRSDNIVAHVPLNELYFDGEDICFDICIEYELINGIKLVENAKQAELLKKLANKDGLMCLTIKLPICRRDLLLARKSFCVLR